MDNRRYTAEQRYLACRTQALLALDEYGAHQLRAYSKQAGRVETAVAKAALLLHLAGTELEETGALASGACSATTRRS